MFPEISAIKSRRRKLGLTQKELSKLSETSQSLIAKLENNKINASYFTIKNIFKTLEDKERKTEKKCYEVMSKNIIYGKYNYSVEKIKDLMKKYDISQIPILKAGKQVGNISEKIILDNLNKNLKRTKAKEIMDEPLPIIRDDTPCSAIIPLLKTSDAILLTKKSKISGIITKADLL